MTSRFSRNICVRVAIERGRILSDEAGKQSKLEKSYILQKAKEPTLESGTERVRRNEEDSTDHTSAADWR